MAIGAHGSLSASLSGAGFGDSSRPSQTLLLPLEEFTHPCREQAISNGPTYQTCASFTGSTRGKQPCLRRKLTSCSRNLGSSALKHSSKRLLQVVAWSDVNSASVLVVEDESQTEAVQNDFTTADVQGADQVRFQDEDLKNDNLANSAALAQVGLEPDVDEAQSHAVPGLKTPSFEELLQRLKEPLSGNNLLDTCIFLLQMCKQEGNLTSAKLVHTQMCTHGLDTHQMLGSYFIAMFVSCGSLQDAQQMFDKLPHPCEFSWTYIIQGYLQGWEPQRALDLYSQMKDNGVHPNAHTLLVSLNSCTRLKAIEKGWEMHTEIAINGFDSNLFIGRALIDFYVKCGLFADAAEVYQDLPVPDPLSWTTLNIGYDKQELYESHVKSTHLDDLPLDNVTVIYSLKACGSSGNLQRGRQMHNVVIMEGFDEKLFVGNALVDMYAKCDSVAEARWILDKLRVRDVVSWTSLITGYADQGLGREALRCLDQMRQDGVFPNSYTMVCILKACGSIKAVKKGYSMHVDLIKMGLDSDSIVSNCLVDMYCRCGLLAEAQDVFNKLACRDTVSWTSLIVGYTESGSAEEALKCLHQMQVEGISPNVATFVCCLKACGLAQALSKGYELHADAVARGYESVIIVGNSLLDMYVKCCSFADAQAVLGNLPDLDVITWTTLISGYADHGLDEAALNCLDQMEQKGVSPNVITYVCSLKACAGLGIAGNIYRLHGEIVKRGLDKDSTVQGTLVDTYADFGKLYDIKSGNFGLKVQQPLVESSLMVSKSFMEIRTSS